MGALGHRDRCGRIWPLVLVCREPRRLRSATGASARLRRRSGGLAGAPAHAARTGEDALRWAGLGSRRGHSGGSGLAAPWRRRPRGPAACGRVGCDPHAGSDLAHAAPGRGLRAGVALLRRRTMGAAVEAGDLGRRCGLDLTGGRHAVLSPLCAALAACPCARVAHFRRLVRGGLGPCRAPWRRPDPRPARWFALIVVLGALQRVLPDPSWSAPGREILRPSDSLRRQPG